MPSTRYALIEREYERRVDPLMFLFRFGLKQFNWLRKTLKKRNEKRACLTTAYAKDPLFWLAFGSQVQPRKRWIRWHFNLISIRKSVKILCTRCFFSSWHTMDVRTTLCGRCYDIKTLKQRPYNVVLTSCAGWLVGFFRNFDDICFFY